jgi:hypothetical protein
LAWVGLHRDVITIDIQAMNHIRADKSDRDGVARIYIKFRGRIRKLSCFDLEGSFLRSNGLDWQWSESHRQSSHYQEEKR